MSVVRLGAIADDLTGATDLAGLLVHHGMRTLLMVGIPAQDIRLPDCDAVIVALKSRAAPAADAVAQALAARQWLRDRGAKQYFFKICSTFDSTDAGNIGPVADALLESVGADIQVVCPAYPATLRTVYQGHLFVGDQLLAESSMRHHPLTPMRDSNLLRLLQRQSRHRVGGIAWPAVARGAAAIADALRDLAREGCRHAVVDAIRDEDLIAIARASADAPLLTGGAGLATGLPENFRRPGHLLADTVASPISGFGGPAAVLAGSCSTASRRQVAYLLPQLPSIAIDPLAAADPERLAALALASLEKPLSRGDPVMIYSSVEPESVAAIQSRLGTHEAANLVEHTFAILAKRLVERGVRRLVVAGGETSGAVVAALKVRALAIGPQIDPGVPWTRVLGQPEVLLALKSGNFGGPDFFQKALAMSQ